MKSLHILLGTLLTITSMTAFASGRTLMCDAPMGPRLDYFTQNTANLQNNQFLVGQDQMSDVHVRLVLDDNNQDVSFAVGSMAQLQSMPEVNNMKVVESSKDQISFLGKVNNAPILASYYSGMNIIIYTQQSMWPGDSFSGARAMLFYARCHDLAAVAPAQPQPAEQVQGLATPPDAVPPATTPAAVAPAATAPATTMPAGQ